MFVKPKKFYQIKKKDLSQKEFVCIIKVVFLIKQYAPIAQLDRALVSGTRFAGGSNPSGRATRKMKCNDNSLLSLSKDYPPLRGSF